MVVNIPIVSSSKNKLEIFPNPAYDVLNVNMNLNKTTNVLIEIYDIFGKLVKFQNLINVEPYSQISINIKDIANGTYIIKTKCENECAYSKFVVLK